jgi:hypothetical protein
MYMRSDVEMRLATVGGGSPAPEWLLQATVVACLVVVVGSFFAVQPLVDLAENAAASLPFG